MKNRKSGSWWAAIIFTTVTAAVATQARAEDKVTPGELVVDHPTLINLGFEWLIQGDDNRNAEVAVSYRRQGDSQWKQALPLLRLQGERIYQENSWDLVSPNMSPAASSIWSRTRLRGAVRLVRS